MKEIEILDLKTLSPEHNRLLNRIASNLRVPFNNFIEELSNGNEDNIDWWVSNIASRNTLSCSLYTNLSYLAFVDHLLNDGYRINRIAVYSRGLAKTFKRHFLKKNISTKVFNNEVLTERFKKIVKPYYSFIFSCIHFFMQYIYARKTKMAMKNHLNNNLAYEIILLDTFVLKNSFRGNSYIDRYYSNIFDFLSESERQQIYYLPTFDKIKDYPTIFKKMRTAKQNFLVKEDFLRIMDYIYALTYLIRMKRIKINFTDFFGIDVVDLLKSEIYQGLALYSSMEALLKYRLAKRLKEKGVRIRLVIDWFENQAIDKGANAGFRRFYGDVPIIGYQGFINSDFYLCAYPTTYEMNYKLLPNKIAVIGNALVDRVKEFCPTLDVAIAPAFRFQRAWKPKENFNDSDILTILTALPIMLSEGNIILKIIAAALMKNEVKNIKNIRVLVKYHPTSTAGQIKRKIGNHRHPEFIFVEGDIGEYIDKADILISGSSTSVCLEALAEGIPVIIIGSQSDISHNPIPEDIKEDIWTLCYSSEEVAQAILFYANRDGEAIKRHKSIGQQIRQNYFEPVTRKSVKRFFGIHQ
jgi:surface carbohydrate biosynthesis protein (TIGR04326 family)